MNYGILYIQDTMCPKQLRCIFYLEEAIPLTEDTGWSVC